MPATLQTSSDTSRRSAARRASCQPRVRPSGKLGCVSVPLALHQQRAAFGRVVRKSWPAGLVHASPSCPPCPPCRQPGGHAGGFQG